MIFQASAFADLRLFKPPLFQTFFTFQVSSFQALRPFRPLPVPAFPLRSPPPFRALTVAPIVHAYKPLNGAIAHAYQSKIDCARRSSRPRREATTKVVINPNPNSSTTHPQPHSHFHLSIFQGPEFSSTVPRRHLYRIRSMSPHDLSSGFADLRRPRPRR